MSKFSELDADSLDMVVVVDNLNDTWSYAFSLHGTEFEPQSQRDDDEKVPNV
jgi:acyl carrier protein